jgi:adenylate cyclase
MKPNIMFVDDSISVLESLQWIFKNEPYYIFTLDNPFDALRVISTLEWAVVITERHMRNMDGLEFMKEVKANSPDTIGIIMNGFNEISEAWDTSYPGCVYQYVKKPLDLGEIKQAVKSAIAQYKLNVESKRQTV